MFFTKSVKSVVKKLKETVSSIGPGFITGAADDDPSGIATFSIAGARFGYGLSWLSFAALPLMIAIQEACARIGIITGRGLAGVIRQHYSRNFLYGTVFLLGIANIVNIGADLGAMANVIAMVFGLPWWFWLVLVTFLTVFLEIIVPYQKYEGFLKWFALFLVSYLITVFIISPSLWSVLKNIASPHLELSFAYLAAAVGLLGTTISPYLFFWQTSEEVEEEIVQRRIHGFGMGRPKFNLGDIKRMRLDTNLGMFFSQLISLAIIVTAAETLNKSGITTISSAPEAAMALKPLAGNFASLLFAAGIVGIGLQAIPVLAGSFAYAVAEVFRAPEGLGKSFSRAKLFYIVIAVSSVAGALLNILGVNPIQSLFYAAIINGVIAVPLIAIVIAIASNKKIMGKETSGFFSIFFSGLALAVLGVAVVAMVFLRP